MHPRSASADQGQRRHCGGCRETTDRLRLPRTDHGFPVAGTLMVEPTESETLEEIDRFCDAMISYPRRDRKDRSGGVAARGQPAGQCPAHAAPVTAEDWIIPTRGGSRPFQPAAHRAALRPGFDKYWPPVGRIDGGFGDRNLVCIALRRRPSSSALLRPPDRPRR